MTCEKIEELLSPYLEDELGSQEKVAIENHLKTCPNCSSLFSCMEEAKKSLGDFPELEVRQNLLKKLYSLPGKKKEFKISLDFLLRPSLQPVFAVASLFLILFSFYNFHPDKHSINKSIDKQIHLGYSKIEKLYTKADFYKDNLISLKENFLDSLQQKKSDFLSEDEY